MTFNVEVRGTGNPNIDWLLAEAEMEAGRFDWEGSFAEYLSMVSRDPSISRLSHKLVYDAIVSDGVGLSDVSGEPAYALFEGKIYGLDDTIDKIVQYFASSSRRLEIRKRILLLLGPPASGKSSLVALIKDALERFTRTNEGSVYAIKGCPMQEDPLHLIPHNLRSKLLDDYGIHIEGDLCPKCRYKVRTEYRGKVSEIPVTRVVFSEQEAVGIGYYVATNPNPQDASLLVGSVDTSRLEGDRLEVAAKAFRLDGELNVANRGLVEFVEIFKANKHLLTTLLGLAQEQLIKMERFGSVYADEAIIGHSNEGDFAEFMSDPHSEALKDRIIAIQVPYNRRVSDELKIYQMMLKSSALDDVHIPPLTLPAASTLAILSRLEKPRKQGVSLIEKLRAYDGTYVHHFTQEDVIQEKRHYPSEGMNGLSPRYVMNRLSSTASAPDVFCISPLLAIDSLWRGLSENVSLDDEDSEKYLGFVKDSVDEYNASAIKTVQRAFDEKFEQTASELLSDYLKGISSAIKSGVSDTDRDSDRSMREMERHAGVTERDRLRFRQEIQRCFDDLRKREVDFDYTTEPRIRTAIEKRLFPDYKTLRAELMQPGPADALADWRRKRGSIHNRLIKEYGYCNQCAHDVVEYVIHLLRGRGNWQDVFKIPKGEDIEWTWDLNPSHLSTSGSFTNPVGD